MEVSDFDFWTDRINATIGVEGRFDNNPKDAGNWSSGHVGVGTLEGTCWGITCAEARARGYTGPMADMPRDEAERIYRQKYIVFPRLDALLAVSPKIAGKTFDTGVNMGSATPVKFIQRALNVLNRQGQSFPDIAVDGGVGDLTIGALTAFLRARSADGERVLLGMISAQQSVRYIEIAEQQPNDEEFEYGWQLNRVLGTT
jgi:lysozyme family protein